MTLIHSYSLYLCISLFKLTFIDIQVLFQTPFQPNSAAIVYETSVIACLSKVYLISPHL